MLMFLFYSRTECFAVWLMTQEIPLSCEFYAFLFSLIHNVLTYILSSFFRMPFPLSNQILDNLLLPS